MAENDNHSIDSHIETEHRSGERSSANVQTQSGAPHSASSVTERPAFKRGDTAELVRPAALQGAPYSKSAETDGDAPKPAWYKRAFFRKLGYALIALLIALTIWGYVLMSENPPRTKRVENVRLSIDGGSEASFRMRNLIISEDMTSYLPSVTVNVSTNLNELPRFDSALGEVVTASINLNDIRVPGVYERSITAVSSIGTPISVEPPTVTITVEKLVTRKIPVSYAFANSLPDGYWHSEPQLDPSSIDLTGTESKMNSIVKANCIIDLRNRTESINESFELLLLDENQNVLDKTGIEGTVPAVTVRMNILPLMEIPVEEYLTQEGDVNENFEITSMTISPPTLSVAAKQEILDSLESSIYLEPIKVTNYYPGTFTQRIKLTGLPNGVTLLSENLFYVTIEVSDKTAERTIGIPFSDVVVEGENTELYEYTYGVMTFNVRLVGPARIVNSLNKDDIVLRLNMEGKTWGTHEIVPVFSVANDPSWVHDGSVEITVPRSFCTITTATPIA